jgi:hypothetical protein
MPKICPKCQSVNSGFADRCSCGFDLSQIEVPELTSSAPASPVAPPAARDGAVFFLRAGQLLALLACAGSVLAVPFAILMPPRDADLGVVISLALVGGVVGLCFWAAMFVVFTEVLRLRADRARAS